MNVIFPCTICCVQAEIRKLKHGLVSKNRERLPSELPNLRAGVSACCRAPAWVSVVFVYIIRCVPSCNMDMLTQPSLLNRNCIYTGVSWLLVYLPDPSSVKLRILEWSNGLHNYAPFDVFISMDMNAIKVIDVVRSSWIATTDAALKGFSPA